MRNSPYGITVPFRTNATINKSRVLNASPLIVLSKLGRLDLLLEPRPDIEVVVPQAVLDEVMRGEPDDPAVSLVPEAVADWMRVIPTSYARFIIRGFSRSTPPKTH